MERSRSKEVDAKLSNSGKELSLKVSNANISLSLLETAAAVWEIPPFNENEAFEITDDFLRGMQSVLVSVGHDTSIPDQLGVTLQLIGDQLHFFSTDSKTLSWSYIPKPDNLFLDYAIFPLIFCQQMLNVCDAGSRLGRLTENTVLVKTTSGRFIFSRLIESQRPLAYTEVVKQHMVPLDKFVPIPEKLRLAVDRVICLFDGHVGEPAEILIAENWLQLHAQTPLGEVKDKIKLEGHDDAMLYVDPTLIKRLLPKQQKLYVSNDSMLLSDEEGNATHFISSSDSTALR